MCIRDSLTESDAQYDRQIAKLDISIHALLTESDHLTYTHSIVYTDFNPRSPHGERRTHMGIIAQDLEISIHALLTESDAESAATEAEQANFNPRSPHGERLNTSDLNFKKDVISIHALLTESDLRGVY